MGKLKHLEFRRFCQAGEQQPGEHALVSADVPCAESPLFPAESLRGTHKPTKRDLGFPMVS